MEASYQLSPKLDQVALSDEETQKMEKQIKDFFNLVKKGKLKTKSSCRFNWLASDI